MIKKDNCRTPKIISLEEAAAMIKSGDTLWVGSGLSIPSKFLDTLADRCEELQNVTVIGETFLSHSKILADPKYGNTFHFVSFYESIAFNFLPFKANKITYIPKPGGPYSETIYNSFNIDVIIVEVCPPDKNKNCNLGITGTATTPYLCKCKGTKIAVINELLQPAYDDGEPNSIPLGDFDYACISNHTVLESQKLK